jgi:hypothetical protein
VLYVPENGHLYIANCGDGSVRIYDAITLRYCHRLGRRSWCFAVMDGSNAQRSRSSLTKDRSQFYKDFALPFYGANRPGANVSQGHWISSSREAYKAVSRTSTIA